MNDMKEPLPDFSDPPVVEVALSVQFDALNDLRTPQLGLLWQEFRDRFPTTEEHPPLDPEIERFGVRPTRKGAVRVEMLDRPPTPRCWFVSKDGTELIQIQQDRFVRNWRKRGDGTKYPRYEKSLRPAFKSDLERFQAFLKREGLRELEPNQCEVTYVNHIPADQGWREYGELGEVITVFQRSFSDSFLNIPEDARLRLRFLMPGQAEKPIGRLHITIEPGYRSDDKQPLLIMKLTARGTPCGDGIDGVLGFLDIGREWVVRGFASITTPKMHKLWGRKK